MAQRRVNIKALGIILVVLLGLIVSLLLAGKVLSHRDPKKFIAAAEMFLKQGNLQEAAANYAMAIEADPTSKNLQVRIAYGDVLHKLGRIDENYAGRDRMVWDSVLERDPTNKEALQRMLTSIIEIVEFRPEPAAITRLHDLAMRIRDLPLDSGKDDAERRRNSDLRASAKAYFHISAIAGLLADIVKSPEEIREATAELDKLLKESLESASSQGEKATPINPDVPYFLATAYVRQAREMRTRGDKKEAEKLERKAFDMFETTVHAQPRNAVLRLRFSQVLRSISDVSDDDTKDDRQDYVVRMRQVLQEAVDEERRAEAERKNAESENKPVPAADPAFAEVYIFYAQYLQRNKDPKAAEDVLRELCKLKPEDQFARLSLASMLHSDPAKRDEAIDLLRKTVTDSGDQYVISYRSRVGLEQQTLSDLTNYLLEAYGTTSEDAKRASLSKEIDDNCQKLIDRVGVVPLTLKLKGRISLVKGGPNGAVDAIPDLEKAKEMLQIRNPSGRGKDWELEFFLAMAYVDTNQTGLAKQRLEDIVEALPSFVPARIMLTRLYINDHDVDNAREQLGEIKKYAPGDPQISKLEMAIYFLEPKKLNPADVEKILAGMPETTPSEIKAKIQVYMAASQYDGAIRLHEMLRAKNPADVETIRSLVQLYMSKDKKDQASKITDEGLAKDPSNISLQIVRAQIDKNREKVLELTQKGIESIADPVNREMNLYEFYTAQNKKPEALQHLDAAEKADPENTRILDLRFGLALQASKWDVAEKYANRLAAKNVDEANGRIYRYRLALVQGNLALAESHARELVKAKPQYARSYLCLGDVLKDQHHFEEALGQYQQALEKQTENIEAYRGVIECYYSLKKQAEAWRYIQQGLKVLPGNGWLREQEIAYFLNYGDPLKALESRKAAATDNPESLGARLAYGAAQWQVAQQFASKEKVKEAQQGADEAKETFNAIVAKWPDDRLAYAYLADIATYKQDFAGGEKSLKDLAARESSKEVPDATVLLADYYARFNKVDLAEASYDAALAKVKSRTDATGVEIAQKMAAFLSSQRKYDKAIDVLKPSATDRRVQQQIVETLLANNKLTEAGQLLDTYLHNNPKDAQFLATRGFLMLQEKKVPEALEIMNKAVALEPRNQTALYYRGMIKLRQGPATIDEAIKDLMAARDITNDPGAQVSTASQIQTRVALAEAFRFHDQIDEALGEMERCLDLQPDNKEIRVRLIEMLGTLVQPRWTEVETLIANAMKMKKYAKDPDWYRLSATMWMARNSAEKALTSIRAAIELSQGQLDRTLPLMQDYLNILNKLKKYRDLEAECNALLQNAAVAKNAWWVYHMRAIALANSDGKRGEALTDFDKALEIAGRLGVRADDATVAIIQSISETIGLEPAITRCEREADKGDNHWRVILAYLYINKKDYKSAQVTIEKVLADTEKLTALEKETALGVAGSIYMLSAEYKKAEDVYQQLLAMKGKEKDTISLNNLACIWTDYMEPPDAAKALTYSQRAMDVMREVSLPDPNIMDTHGWVLANVGTPEKLDEGITYIQAALDKRQMMEARYHMGIALLKKNLGPEALQQLDKARKMLDDRKNKGQTIDQVMEVRLNEGLAKARLMVNGSAGPATAPISSGTPDVLKP